ncbi:MAG: hypothetical protein RL141_1085, partial [Candidatus Parcubacteria bacterium]
MVNAIGIGTENSKELRHCFRHARDVLARNVLASPLGAGCRTRFATGQLGLRTALTFR